MYNCSLYTKRDGEQQMTVMRIFRIVVQTIQY